MTGDAVEKAHWTEKLQTFDRRWIFLAMGVAIVVPLIVPFKLPVKVSPMVRAIYNTVEELEEGDTVLLSVDLDPASTPELEPFYRAVVLHLKRKNIKMVVATTWYQAPPLVEKWIRQTIDRPLIPPGGAPGYTAAPDRAYQKNVDYVWLGFREGKQAVMQAMGKDLRGTFDDSRGRWNAAGRHSHDAGHQGAEGLRPHCHGVGGISRHQGMGAAGPDPLRPAHGRLVHRGIDHRSDSLL